MKKLNSLINLTLALATLVVTAIFVLGTLKPKENKTEQSSVSDKPTRTVTAQDELTNKYIKEIQSKLKKDELSAAQEFKKARDLKKFQKPKDEDWTKVPLDQQISKDEPDEVDRHTAGSRTGVVLNKETAAEFIETARKNGYHVILSDSYEVLSVTPILNKKINDSFETNPSQ